METRDCQQRSVAEGPSLRDTLERQSRDKVKGEGVLKRQKKGWKLGEGRCGKEVGGKQSEGRPAPSNMLEV